MLLIKLQQAYLLEKKCMSNLKKLEEKICYTFNDIKYLERALTHSSYANENFCSSNETMEFVGDSVLDLCVAQYLFKTKDIAEGEMTKLRATYVCEEALVIYANKMELSDHLKLGVGEESSGGRTRCALIADAFEAVLGAVFLDANFEECYKVFSHIVLPYIENIDVLDNKSKLQELMQADKRTILYDIIQESGPAHNKTFDAIAILDNSIVLGKGRGKTKKEAEQNAAKEALSKIAK